MSSTALSVSGLGMVSSLAIGAELNALAMQLKYDAFQESSFMQPYDTEKQIAAMIELEEEDVKNIRGVDKLIYIACKAMNEALLTVSPEEGEIVFLLCVPDQESPRSHNDEEYAQKLFNSIVGKFSQYKFSKKSQPVYRNRTGFVYALQLAQTLIYEQNEKYVLILGIDSLVNSSSLAAYGGNMDGEDCRLLCDVNSNGFIPGEAASAVLVSLPNNEKNNIYITGVGTSEEMAVVDSDDVNKGLGLSQAIKNAEKQSGTLMHEIPLRIASVSGEEYFFKEAALAQIKTMTKVIDDQPLWHPADSIGEVGAAIGPSMLVMAFYSLHKGYAPGNKIMCHISDDDTYRGAFIMEKKSA